MNTRGYTAYKRSSANLVQRKDELLLMLYEGAIRFITLAQKKFEEDDLAGKGEYISKTLSILSELDCALDHDTGGDIATNLSRLYQYMIHCLTQANIHNDPSQLVEVANLLRQLQEAFTEAVKSEGVVSIPQATPQPGVAKGLNLAV